MKFVKDVRTESLSRFNVVAFPEQGAVDGQRYVFMLREKAPPLSSCMSYLKQQLGR